LLRCRHRDQQKQKQHSQPNCFHCDTARWRQVSLQQQGSARDDSSEQPARTQNLLRLLDSEKNFRTVLHRTKNAAI
jgi:hypothetical protein